MKIKYEIWQLPPSSPNKFKHYDWCKTPIRVVDYVMVYAGNIKSEFSTEETLEMIFELLNINHPYDYHVASLSVSDVVCLIDGNNKRSWWYVDGMGFKKLAEEFEV